MLSSITAVTLSEDSSNLVPKNTIMTTESRENSTIPHSVSSTYKVPRNSSENDTTSFISNNRFDVLATPDLEDDVSVSENISSNSQARDVKPTFRYF